MINLETLMRMWMLGCFSQLVMVMVMALVAVEDCLPLEREAAAPYPLGLVSANKCK